MKPITFLTGDATNPVRHPDEKVLIAHVVNDEGRWGRGFVVALSQRDNGPEQAYRLWHAQASIQHLSILGKVRAVPFSPVARQPTPPTTGWPTSRGSNVWVANMCAQKGWRRGGNGPQALDPEALKWCLFDVAQWVTDGHYDRVVMPRIGAGLSGAHWTDVQAIIERELCEKDVHVTVYSLLGSTW